MAEIQLQNLSKRWGSFIGDDKFDLSIADREFLVLLGPSCCGRTTTMRMVAGLEGPNGPATLGLPAEDAAVSEASAGINAPVHRMELGSVHCPPIDQRILAEFLSRPAGI